MTIREICSVGDDFVSIWLRENKTSLGRPVGVKVRDNGTIYISDDKAGIIYRLVFSKGA